MTWEQKFQAAGALGRIGLHMRKPGGWYVSHNGVSKITASFIEEGCVTGGKTPEEAVEAHWAWLTEGEPEIRCRGERLVRWNGFMWQEAAGA